MKREASILLFIGALLSVACSHISEDERIIYVPPVNISRGVLIEDFTGQRCINCPKAADEIHSLQQQYGDTVVIAVAIHSGPLGWRTSRDILGLVTDTGDDYYAHWNIDHQPCGIVNRNGEAIEYSQWATVVRDEIQQTATLGLELTAHCDTVSRQAHATISALGISGATDGALQLWAVEDSVVALQMMPDGVANYEYVHNHVFRFAINGVWGEPFNIGEGEIVDADYDFSISDEYQLQHISIVAFVTNTTGKVVQVIQSKVQSE